MFSRRKSLKFALDYRSVYSTFILLALSDAAPPSGRLVIGEVGGGDFFLALNKIDDIRQEVLDEGEYLRDAKTVVEAMCREFLYPVKTRLELTDPRVTTQTDPVTGRVRRDDKTATALTHDVSAKDYMSTYYAQRKAIMDKYKSQQKEIMERLNKTKSLMAETRKLKESKNADLGGSNATRGRSRDPEAPNSTATYYDGDGGSTISPDPTSSSLGFSQTTNSPGLGVPIFNSAILNDTRETNSNSSSRSSTRSSDDEAADYSTEVDESNTTLRPLENEDGTEITDGPDPRALEGDWPNESVNLIPQNEVDFNLSEKSWTRREESDNQTVIDLANFSLKNDSALDQLEKMFLWEMPLGDARFPRSNETRAAARQIDEGSGPENVNIIPSDDRSDDSTRSSDSLRFTVEIKSSPEVRLTKNIKNFKSSTTTYRNSTHEIVEINGVVNSTKRTNGVPPPDVDPSVFENTNFENPNVTEPAAEIGGGARESEWCEECPHDYRWGDCEGTLFYQHNIFLRNRGPSAIDAIFGMNVQGPVDITCVEAIRFNKTRGIVTLHSGGPGHDFAKLRIRGFQGEGFSYIMKVWGVGSSEGPVGTNETNIP